MASLLLLLLCATSLAYGFQLNIHFNGRIRMTLNDNNAGERINKVPYKMVEPKTARERASFKNKVPFDEGIYETIKKTIELLTHRLESGKPLQSSDTQWLRNNIPLIIDDANKYLPPERPPPSAKEDE